MSGPNFATKGAEHLKEQQLARIRQDKGVHRDLFYMCLPLLAMAFAFYGLRAVLLCGTANKI